MMGSAEILWDENYAVPDTGDLRVAEISRARKRDERRYTTGLDNVDASASLMQPGGFVVLGAREGQGKTAYAERIACSNAHKHRVLFASLDMRREFLQDRILSKSMQVNVERVNELTDQNDMHYQNAMKRLSELDLMIWKPRKGAKTVRHIIEHAEKVSAAILIIDYTRLIDGWDYGKRAADIVDTLADWAHDASITTVLLTQLRDEAVNRRPHAGYIQDTSQLAQRADRIQLIYRPYHGRPHKDTVAEILTTKNRWGPPVMNHAGWIGETQDFYPLTAEEEANSRCCSRNK